MKRLFPVIVTVALLSIMAQPVLADPAADGSSNINVANTEKLIQKMAVQTNALETQMKTLKKQIRELKRQQQQLQQQNQAITHNQQHIVAAIPATQMQVAPGLPAQTIGGTGGACHITPPVSYLSGTPVVIAPYVGEHTAFNACDLIVYYSSYNEDLQLLKLRQGVYQQYRQQNQPVPTAPMLMLSGKVEGTAAAVYGQPQGGHTSRIDLASAELDIIPTLNEWAGGYIALKYDNSQAPNMPLTSNSRTYVDKAFLTFGNLNEFPVYMTLGQLYVPFGSYSSNMIAAPITQLVFRTRARALLLGYQHADGQGIYGQIYGFNGDTTTHHSGNVNDLGANLGFSLTSAGWNVDASVGAIANVADSQGMQQTGAVANSFGGFSVANPTTATPEVLQRQVPGLAAHVNVGVGSFGLISEYITATSAFAPQDMTYNGTPAKPRALNIETYYNFPLFTKPSAITLGYGQSWDSLALNVPRSRYIAAFTTSVWKDTIEELEFRHDVNYNIHDSATAAGVTVPQTMKGGANNTVMAQLGIYF